MKASLFSLLNFCLLSISRVRVSLADSQHLRLSGLDSPALVVRVACDKAEDEVAEHHRAEGKGRVAHDAHPSKFVHQTRLQELRRACVPSPRLDRRPRLHQ